MNFNFDTEFLKAVKTDEGLFLEGVASTSGVDRQYETMSKAALDQFAATPGLIPIVTSHNAEAADVIGEVVDHKLDVNGNYFIKARLEDSDPTAVRMWNLINKGHKLGFSVGGRVLSYKPSFNKAVRRIIDAVSLDHIMLTRRPVQPQSYAHALTKAMTMEDTEILEKAGAKHSASTLEALGKIRDIGSEDVKALVDALLGTADGADAPAENDAADVPANPPIEDAPAATAQTLDAVADPANIADGDHVVADAPVNLPVAGKALSADEFTLLKAEVIKTLQDEVRAEFARSVISQPKAPEVLAKSENPNPYNGLSLEEAIRQAIGG